MPTAAEYEYLVRFSEPAAPSTWYYIGHTTGRSTSSGDTPASTYVPPSLGSPPGFSLRLFDGVDPVLNPRGSIGSVLLTDPTGVLDTYCTSKVTDGGILELRRAARTDPPANLSTFSTIATFATAGVRYGHNTKEFRLHNLGRILESSLLHDNRYSGEGGAGGDAQLKGQIRPYGIGPVFNITPKLVNATEKIYQLSDSAIWAIAAVKEGGSALGYGTDRANYAAMAASAPAAGVYDSCFAEGYIRLGSSPTLPITVDFTGDTEPSVPYLLRGNIAKRIVTRSGTVLTSGQVDSTALSALNTAKSEDCGFYWDKEITKAAALTEVMQSILGYWYVNLSGSLILGYMTAPGASPDVTYAFPDVVGEPQMIEGVRPPRWKTSVAYQRNYTIMDRSKVPSVTDAVAQLLAEDALWESDADGTVYSANPTSYEKRVFAGFDNSTDAAAEAVLQQAIFEDPPELWQVQIRTDPFTLAGYLGRPIGISGYTRYSWSNPRVFRLVGVDWGADLIPTAILWG